jgi:CheY-like chemotaxis protein
MKELLTQIDASMEIEQALHGKEALEKVLEMRRSPLKPYFDFIFLDIHMPVLDGYEVIIFYLYS